MKVYTVSVYEKSDGYMIAFAYSYEHEAMSQYVSEVENILDLDNSEERRLSDTLQTLFKYGMGEVAYKLAHTYMSAGERSIAVRITEHWVPVVTQEVAA